MRKTALLHIKFALCATRGSFSSLFIRCYAQQRQQAIPRGENRGTIAGGSCLRGSSRCMTTCCCCCCCFCSATAVVILEIRDSQDRRNIADRKPRRRGVLDNAVSFPGAGTTALTRPAFAESEETQEAAVPEIYSNARGTS